MLGLIFSHLYPKPEARFEKTWLCVCYITIIFLKIIIISEFHIVGVICTCRSTLRKYSLDDKRSNCRLYFLGLVDKKK